MVREVSNVGYSNKNSYSTWRLTLLAGVSGGAGGLLVDADHILSAITRGAVSWSFLHSGLVTWILIGCVVTFSLGLYATLVLGKED